MSEWVQRILCAGEAFSGMECTTLRNMLATQSGNFFRSFHASNLEALNSMLEKELWRRLPNAEGAGTSTKYNAVLQVGTNVVATVSSLPEVHAAA